ncbi:MAG: hypothetical protein IT556_08410, partial [Acetobacteraceae bacterium]|nr:hypothetical protein [Acetobacteraceae bacterium]
MPDGRPGGGLPDGLLASAPEAHEGGSGGRLDKGWKLLGAGGIALGPSDIVLAHPNVGVALLQIEPCWTPDAVQRLRDLLEDSGFSARFPGQLPVIHRRFRSELLPELPTLLGEAFAWQAPMSLPPGAPWIEALSAAIADARHEAGEAPAAGMGVAAAPPAPAAELAAPPAPSLPAPSLPAPSLPTPSLPTPSLPTLAASAEALPPRALPPETPLPEPAATAATAAAAAPAAAAMPVAAARPSPPPPATMPSLGSTMAEPLVRRPR